MARTRGQIRVHWKKCTILLNLRKMSIQEPPSLLLRVISGARATELRSLGHTHARLLGFPLQAGCPQLASARLPKLHRNPTAGLLGHKFYTDLLFRSASTQCLLCKSTLGPLARMLPSWRSQRDNYVEVKKQPEDEDKCLPETGEA